MQGVCTTILQAAHFLLDTDFCCGKRGPLRHQATPSLDAAPGQAEKFSHLHQHGCPLCVPGTPSIGSWHQDTAPISLSILRQPTEGGAQVRVLLPLSPEGLQAIQPAGVSLQASRPGSTTRGQRATHSLLTSILATQYCSPT